MLGPAVCVCVGWSRCVKRRGIRKGKRKDNSIRKGRHETKKNEENEKTKNYALSKKSVIRVP